MSDAERRARRIGSRVAANLSGKGIYTVPVAARLLRVTPSTIQRWAFGYHRRGVNYPPAIKTDIPSIGQSRALHFLELVELMFIQALLGSGLSWHEVREASRVAANFLHDEPHPLAMKRWFADAAAVYLQLGQKHGEPLLIEVAGHAQIAMEPMLQPYLHQLDFDVHGIARRWFPMGPTSPIVLDPRRAFGMPTTSKGGVPTETIARLHVAGDSISTIAAWYAMDEAEVEAAVQFEESLSTAA